MAKAMPLVVSVEKREFKRTMIHEWPVIMISLRF